MPASSSRRTGWQENKRNPLNISARMLYGRHLFKANPVRFQIHIALKKMALTERS